MQNLFPFSVIIPAAGNSGRMGSEKPLLQLADGKTFLENLVIKYTEYGAEPVVIIVNNTFNLSRIDPGSYVCVVNDHVGCGRSYSIRLGVQYIPSDHICFIQNVDNPFVDAELLDNLLGSVKDDSYVIPVYNCRGGHPVLLGKNIVSTIATNSPLADFREVLKKFTRIEIPWKDPRILLNINTPEDYRKFTEGI